MKNLFLLLAFALLTTQVHAGIYAEPFVGTANLTTSTDVSSVEDDDSSATVYGARLGWALPMINFGVDYQVLADGDDSVTNTSAYIGVRMPMVKFWAKYIMTSSILADGEEPTLDYSLSSGYGLGVGYTGLPFVDLNFELINYTHTYENVPVLGEFDVENVGYALTLSFPFGA